MFLRAIVTCTFLLLVSFCGEAKTYIFTDIDDTIRMSNVRSCAHSIKRILFGANPFPWAQKLFHSIAFAKGEVGELMDANYVTAGRTFSAPYWVNRHDFPAGTVIQRSLGEGKKEFKIRVLLRRIRELGKASDDEFLFFGDNTEYDLEVYRAVITKLKLKNAKIYIRDVKMSYLHAEGRIIDSEQEDVRFYVTEFDLIKNGPMRLVKDSFYSQLVERPTTREIIPPYMRKNLADRFHGYCKSLELVGRACEEFVQDSVEECLSEYIRRGGRWQY